MTIIALRPWRTDAEVPSTPRDRKLRCQFAALFLSMGFLGNLGCADTLKRVDRGVYDTTKAVAPAHPVTGQPVLNLMSQSAEIERAEKDLRKIREIARRERIRVDPPGARFDQINRVFSRLVVVAHRQDLPWQIHLVDSPDVNAWALGGGYVVVFEGLFGGLIPVDNDEALAAVLAHEIAHNTLLHVVTREMNSKYLSLLTKEVRDPFYTASFSTEEEAEADRLGALYMALAGYNPFAAAEVWDTAHEKRGSSEGGFLYTHPLNSDRAAGARAAAELAQDYWAGGQQHPDWQEILENNSLFPRASDPEYQPGDGMLRALTGALEAYKKHRGAEVEADRRKDALRDVAERKQRELQAIYASVRIIRIWEQPTADGFSGIFYEIYNGSSKTLTGLRLDIHFWQGQNHVGTDPSCQLASVIPPGYQASGGCYKRAAPGVTSFTAQVGELFW